jgi:hypothetical protein
MSLASLTRLAATERADLAGAEDEDFHWRVEAEG